MKLSWYFDHHRLLRCTLYPAIVKHVDLSLLATYISHAVNILPLPAVAPFTNMD